MKKQEKILKIINEKFVEILGLDWFGFKSQILELNGSYHFFLYRNNEELKKKDVIYYVIYVNDGRSKETIAPYISKNNFKSLILYQDVSDILYTILNKPEYDYSLYGTFFGEFGKTITDFPNYDKNQEWLMPTEKNLVLYKDGKIQFENLKIISEEIFDYLKTYHFPFFQKVSSLQVVNDEIIDKVPQMELGNYLAGKYMNPKKLIIMKLCNNPKYEEFKSWLVEVFEKVIISEPEKYLEDYQVVLSTIDFLDSGKYKDLV